MWISRTRWRQGWQSSHQHLPQDSPLAKPLSFRDKNILPLSPQKPSRRPPYKSFKQFKPFKRLKLLKRFELFFIKSVKIRGKKSFSLCSLCLCGERVLYFYYLEYKNPDRKREPYIIPHLHPEIIHTPDLSIKPTRYHCIVY